LETISVGRLGWHAACFPFYWKNFHHHEGGIAMSVQAATALEGAREASDLKTAVWASVLGTMIEWYDFLIYGTAAALVFNKLFFPAFNPLTGTLAAFATYAVGFAARPLGGAIFGHFGDRIGRKAMLITTLLVMGIGTFLIGCLPTYADIGIWAPIALVTLRLLQGIGIGGEWGGAVLMVVENAPNGKRGYYGSLVQAGFPLGIAASTGIFSLLTQILPEDAFLAWGWRIPFLVSIALVGIGLFIRLRLSETPAFKRLQREENIARSPLIEVIVKNPRPFLIAVGMKISEVGWVYVLIVFSVFYCTTKLGLPKQLVLNGIVAGAILELFTIPLFGVLSDRLGRKALYYFGLLASIAAAYPVFSLLETKDPTTVVLTIAIALSLTHGTMFGPQAAYMTELFGTRIRYSGASLGCQIAAAVSGGFAPIIATGLLAATGGTGAISIYLIALAVISLIAIIASEETAKTDIMTH
jgi:MFS transporter, MHS family, shikimate and dehydroshikimate transport protein